MIPLDPTLPLSTLCATRACELVVRPSAVVPVDTTNDEALTVTLEHPGTNTFFETVAERPLRCSRLPTDSEDTLVVPSWGTRGAEDGIDITVSAVHARPVIVGRAHLPADLIGVLLRGERGAVAVPVISTRRGRTATVSATVELHIFLRIPGAEALPPAIRRLCVEPAVRSPVPLSPSTVRPGGPSVRGAASLESVAHIDAAFDEEPVTKHTESHDNIVYFSAANPVHIAHTRGVLEALFERRRAPQQRTGLIAAVAAAAARAWKAASAWTPASHHRTMLKKLASECVAPAIEMQRRITSAHHPGTQALARYDLVPGVDPVRRMRPEPPLRVLRPPPGIPPSPSGVLHIAETPFRRAQIRLVLNRHLARQIYKRYGRRDFAITMALTQGIPPFGEAQRRENRFWSLRMLFAYACARAVRTGAWPTHIVNSSEAPIVVSGPLASPPTTYLPVTWPGPTRTSRPHFRHARRAAGLRTRHDLMLRGYVQQLVSSHDELVHHANKMHGTRFTITSLPESAWNKVAAYHARQLLLGKHRKHLVKTQLFDQEAAWDKVAAYRARHVIKSRVLRSSKRELMKARAGGVTFTRIKPGQWEAVAAERARIVIREKVLPKLTARPFSKAQFPVPYSTNNTRVRVTAADLA